MNLFIIVRYECDRNHHMTAGGMVLYTGFSIAEVHRSFEAAKARVSDVAHEAAMEMSLDDDEDAEQLYSVVHGSLDDNYAIAPSAAVVRCDGTTCCEFGIRLIDVEEIDQSGED